jgi:hypothetical protein
MAYGIQNLTQASMGGRPPRQDVQRLARMGLEGDDTIAHLTSGEMVIPKSMQTPGIMSIVAGKMRQQGVDPSEYIVGTPQAQATRNPYTGAQQFPEPGMGGKSESDGYGGRDGRDSRDDNKSSKDSWSPESWSEADWDWEKNLTEAYGSDYGSQFGPEGRYSMNKPEGIWNRLKSTFGIGSYTDPWTGQTKSYTNPANLVGGGIGTLLGLSPAVGAKIGGKLSEWTGIGQPTAANQPGPAATYGGSQMAEAVGTTPTGNERWERNQLNEGGSIGQRRLAELVGGGNNIEAIKAIGGPVSTTPPGEIDYLHYGELSPDQGGGEKLMYPWQLQDGQTSYGQYPLFGGIEGFGAAPSPGGTNQGQWSRWRDRVLGGAV